jgi:drug/metabolite transporter (DMT)-like permease
MTTASPWRGVGSMVLSTATFLCCDTLMKLAVADVPPLEVLALRGAFATCWCVPLLLALGYRAEIPQAASPWVLARAVSESCAVMLFIIALSRMPIGDLTAIMQTAPLIIVLVAALAWRERIGPVRAGLVVLGFAGAVMVAQPASPAASWMTLIAFPAAALAAGRDLLSRMVPAGVPGLVTALATILVVMFASALANSLFGHWVMPSPLHLAQLAGAGFFLMCGQFFVFMAYRLAPAGVVAPFNYTAALWAVFSGVVVFGDVPNAIGLTGIGLIVVSGVAVVMLGERRRRAEAALAI